MAWFVGTVLLIVGLGFTTSGARADLAVRLGQHTQGRIVSASKARLTDDGRQLWNVEVSFPAGAGQEVSVWALQHGTDVDRRIGEQVDVWFNPRRPERARVVLGENAAGTSWVQYAFGLMFTVAGAGVLVARLT